MELVKRAFSTKTAGGRMVRTFVQACGAMLAFCMALVHMPEFEKVLTDLGIVGVMTTIAGFVTAASGVHSAIESAWRRLSAWADEEMEG